MSTRTTKLDRAVAELRGQLDRLSLEYEAQRLGLEKAIQALESQQSATKRKARTVAAHPAEKS